jgi:hypothetical protein
MQNSVINLTLILITKEKGQLDSFFSENSVSFWEKI